ncbi:MAG: restriction endonuclease subunit S [Saprospiraceae bacterium]|nr:restriction endonuclease subunit S [Saprospiraceae bacterium]MCF8252162.1 restriction endonuclease subunit S [Saprospiraceae bacterium]MCF8313831.1 restriction endonuclease subunit S [Saprospiraceae bacterium]MCF8442537.1 restriction endonuclease subunit S [Saprospiraceae bacterium]
MNKDTKKTAAPKLRFPEFREAEGWEEKPLEKIATFSKGKGISKSDISENGVLPCIRYGELYTYYSETIDEVISYTNLPRKDLVLSQANDVIIPASGETQEDIATASCVLKNGIALGGDLNIIRSKMNGVFLSYYLNNAKKKDIAQMAQGISVVHLYSGQLKQLNINIPKPPEQQKIAACLTSLDELISAESDQLAALQAHKKGLMQQLFPAERETAPRRRFGEFEGEWEEKVLGKCLLQKPDYGINAPAVPFSDNLPTYLRITDISEDGHFLRENKVSVAKEVTEDNYLKEGDIVLARTGASVGKSYKYRTTDGRLVFAGFLIRMKPNEKKINSELLFQFLSTETYWRWVAFVSARSGQPGINSTEYASMPIPLPPTLAEQQKIAACFTTLDELIAAQGEKIAALQAHKKGLMQGLFPNPNETQS